MKVNLVEILVLVFFIILFGIIIGAGLCYLFNNEEPEINLQELYAFTDFYQQYERDIAYIQEQGATKEQAEVIYAAAISEDLPIWIAGTLGKIESAYQRKALSSRGAIGLFQIMPATARLYGFDPARLHEEMYNAKAGCRIFKEYFKNALSIEEAAIAYNAGPHWIGKKNLPKETKRYVSLLAGAYAAL